jgi:hypothetical protein
MNEQMIGNAQQLRERLGTSEQYEVLRRRIAELEEENRQLRAGVYRGEEHARSIDAEVASLDNPSVPISVQCKRLLALPADSLRRHEGLRAWFADFEEREGLDLSKVPDDLAGSLSQLHQVLD